MKKLFIVKIILACTLVFATGLDAMKREGGPDIECFAPCNKTRRTDSGQQNQDPITTIYDIPQHVLSDVFGYLPLNDRAMAARVCRTWHNVASAGLYQELPITFGELCMQVNAFEAEVAARLDYIERNLDNVVGDTEGITDRKFLEAMVSLFSLAGEVEAWCEARSFSARKLAVYSRIDSALRDCNTEAIMDYENKASNYYDAVVDYAIAWNNEPAVRKALSYFTEITNERYFSYLKRAMRNSAADVIQYFIKVLRASPGVNLVDLFNSVCQAENDGDALDQLDEAARARELFGIENFSWENNGFWELDRMLLNHAYLEVHPDENYPSDSSERALKVLIFNGAKANGIYKNDKFLPLQRLYERLLAEVSQHI